jgi:hypothetical protein
MHASIGPSLRATPVFSVILARHLPRSVAIARYCFAMIVSGIQCSPQRGALIQGS